MNVRKLNSTIRLVGALWLLVTALLFAAHKDQERRQYEIPRYRRTLPRTLLVANRRSSQGLATCYVVYMTGPDTWVAPAVRAEWIDKRTARVYSVNGRYANIERAWIKAEDCGLGIGGNVKRWR